MKLEDFAITITDFAQLVGRGTGSITKDENQFGAHRRASTLNGEIREYRLQDGLRELVVSGMIKAGIEPGKAWPAVMKRDVLAEFMAGRLVEFGLFALTPLEKFDALTPAIRIPIGDAAQNLVNAFAAHLVRAHGGPAAHAALADFDARCQAVRVA
ncbi:hypothetical protein [Paracoccus versutus]|uniref:Uncharacterized protein n=1 Tax=Paracoccus versutus TaxID=34007 RepID=A0A3D9XUG8_PARVE|nr:hypothetical protein [Paracoccus versutus]REF72783.1 hypothetical protein BDD41_1276 [Paracoccus versutus]WGR55285.1 hypothetical protein E3U25_04520 [Paracoccus versutus]